MSAVPSGQGAACDGEAEAGEAGSPLPSRPERSAANDARYGGRGVAGAAPQDGFGTENMLARTNPVGGPSVRVQDEIAPPPDLASLGDGGQTFGGA